jgi:hypothetical protein
MEVVIKGTDEAVAAAKRGVLFLIENIPEEVPSEKARKTPCKYFAQGHCSRGRDCTFAHGEEVEETSTPIPRKGFRTILCKYFEQGTCQKGKDCSFLHELGRPKANSGVESKENQRFRTVACRFFSEGKCFKGASCTFLHDTTVNDSGDESETRASVVSGYSSETGESSELSLATRAWR